MWFMSTAIHLHRNSVPDALFFRNLNLELPRSTQWDPVTCRGSLMPVAKSLFFNVLILSKFMMTFFYSFTQNSFSTALQIPPAGFPGPRHPSHPFLHVTGGNLDLVPGWRPFQRMAVAEDLTRLINWDRLITTRVATNLLPWKLFIYIYINIYSLLFQILWNIACRDSKNLYGASMMHWA